MRIFILITLYKSIEWEYENEYRVFKDLKNAEIKKGQDKYLFKFPKNLISAIYCGCNMGEENRKKIKKIIDNDIELSHVKIYHTEISKKYYKLEFNQIL